MRIKETCLCGSSAEVDSTSDYCTKYIDGWRRRHKHVLSSQNFPTLFPRVTSTQPNTGTTSSVQYNATPSTPTEEQW